MLHLLRAALCFLVLVDMLVAKVMVREDRGSPSIFSLTMACEIVASATSLVLLQVPSVQNRHQRWRARIKWKKHDPQVPGTVWSGILM